MTEQVTTPSANDTNDALQHPSLSAKQMWAKASFKWFERVRRHEQLLVQHDLLLHNHVLVLWGKHTTSPQIGNLGNIGHWSRRGSHKNEETVWSSTTNEPVAKRVPRRHNKTNNTIRQTLTELPR